MSIGTKRKSNLLAYDLSRIVHAFAEGQNVILAHERPEVESRSHRIEFRWSGDKHYLGFILTIIYLMQRSQVWSAIGIRINRFVEKDGNPAQHSDNLKAMLANCPIEAAVSVWPKEKMSTSLQGSGDCQLAPR